MIIPIANLYYLLCYAWRHVREADIVRREELAGLDGTHHLLGKVLAEGTFRLIRGGIDRGYREIREDLAGIRGKLSVGETVKRALHARGRAACEFEELSHDVLHNRILRSTLSALLKLPDLDSDRVRPDIRTAYRKLEGISPVRLERRLFPRVQLDRNRYLYRFLMSICELIHDCLIVEERSGTARFRDLPSISPTSRTRRRWTRNGASGSAGRRAGPSVLACRPPSRREPSSRSPSSPRGGDGRPPGAGTGRCGPLERLFRCGT